MKRLGVVALMYLITGCGYSFVKKSDLRMRRLAADSVHIVSLEAQLATLQAQHTDDSTRYDALVKKLSTPPATPPNNAAADSVLRARDQEIQTLRDQLAKLTTEMDRIKRRLASPRS